MSGPSAEKQRILDLNREYVAPGKVKMLEAFGIRLVIGRREGYHLWDVDGHQLMDFHLNGGTFSLGHRNPEVVATLVDACGELDIGNHHFPSRARGELAEKLAADAPGDLHYTVYAAGGSEANDIAIKSARRATGRRRIVAVEAGYHGRTGLSGAAGDSKSARFFLSDYPEEFVRVPFNDLDAMETALRDGDVAAVLMETVPATYGFPLPADGYLPGVKRLCEQYGTLYVADEVQTGLGRSGHLWAIEHFGVEPDILVTGKGLSGGMYPIAAALLSRPVGKWLSEDGWAHVSTFGGAELGCVVAGKVLEITTRPETTESVRRVATRIGDGLRAIRERNPFLAEVRQLGVILGLRFDHPQGAMLMMRQLYDRGVWAFFAGFDYSVLQLKPGLFIDDAYCDAFLERFEDALEAVSGR